jgi:hypothetical protein
MKRCLKEECPHFKEYEPYLYCRLIDKDIDGKLCTALLIKDEALETWKCKMAKIQAKIDCMNDLDNMFDVRS